MTTIVTRTTVGSNTGKGSPLTHTEVDTNFVNLNTAKLETAAIPLGTLGAPSISFLSYSTTGIYSPAGDELGVSMLGSDKIRIKSTGEIIINATASRTTLSTTPRLQIEGSASSNQCSMSLTGAGAGGTLFPRLHLSKARSSVNAIVLEDDILGFISFNGGDGSSLVNAGFIKAEVDGTPSAGIVPGRLVFATVDTAGSSGERMIIKNNGNVSIDGTTFNVDAVNNRVGIGTSSPGSLLSVSSSSTTAYSATAFNNSKLYLLGGSATGAYNSIGFTNQAQSEGLIGFVQNASGYGDFVVQSYTGSYAEKMRITSGGLVGIGSTSPNQLLQINSTSVDARIQLTNSVTGSTNNDGFHLQCNNSDIYFDNKESGNFIFQSGANEAARIDSSRRLLVGTSTDTDSETGTRIKPGVSGGIYVTNNTSDDGARVLLLNRQGGDGNLVDFRESNTLEGAISVSGTTVTYGGGHLARWSQLPNEEDPSILLKGTVMSNLDEMCEWGEEDNEQLNKTKISDVEGDKNIAGVFVATSSSEDGPLDFFVGMTGDMVIRIAEGVTVERGDLLMSAGGGTAKPQDDDIIRSKTIAKVTSTNVSCTYDDGSYCVPCVLMAC